MNSGENLPVQEIVIIRRKHDDQGDGHHGGMWKIAFADFMTAMMAFFLVMWLINATDEKTKIQISTYFNPIKLPDQQRVDKALQTSDSAPGENQESVKEPNAKTENAKTEKDAVDDHDTKGKRKTQDEALFTDPYGVLSKLATQVVKIPLPAPGGKDGEAQFSGGAAFRDPFDPDFHRRNGKEPQERAAADPGYDTPNPAMPDDPVKPPHEGAPAGPGGLTSGENVRQSTEPAGKAPEANEAGQAVKMASAAPSSAAKKTAAGKEAMSPAEESREAANSAQNGHRAEPAPDGPSRPARYQCRAHR